MILTKICNYFWDPLLQKQLVVVLPYKTNTCEYIVHIDKRHQKKQVLIKLSSKRGGINILTFSAPTRSHLFQLALTQEEKKKGKMRGKRLSTTLASTKKKLGFIAG